MRREYIWVNAMKNDLGRRIESIFGEMDECLNAQLCLFTYRAKQGEVDKLTDKQLESLCREFRVKLEHARDQYAAVTCELKAMAESDPSQFGREQVWTMLRAIKIQDQLLKMHIGGELLNV